MYFESTTEQAIVDLKHRVSGLRSIQMSLATYDLAITENIGSQILLVLVHDGTVFKKLCVACPKASAKRFREIASHQTRRVQSYSVHLTADPPHIPAQTMLRWKKMILSFSELQLVF